MIRTWRRGCIVMREDGIHNSGIPSAPITNGDSLSRRTAVAPAFFASEAAHAFQKQEALLPG
jgi:hypothetical protein